MRVTTAYRDRIVREYREAYEAANNTQAPSVVWESGWFIVGGIRFRRRALEEMRDRLRVRARDDA